MQISHAIRGEEWISSAPKHLQLYEAFGLEPTRFAHLPLIVGADRKKLSKRSGDTALLDYREKGYLPDAMLNFLVLLGWALDDKTTIVSREELLAHFALERVVPNPAVFDLDRLNHLNGHYIRQLSESAWEALVADWAERDLGTQVPRPLDAGLLRAAAPLLRERTAVLTDIGPMIEFLFVRGELDYATELLYEKSGGGEETAVAIVDHALLALDALAPGDWSKETIEAAIRGLEVPLGLKLRKFIATLYVAVMGRPQGIPLFDSMVLLGREESLRRLRSARGRLR
jgi:glutamyl-tRNA synthetase